MRRQFPLFNSHLDLAHCYWEKLLREGDWAIDTTCGNGHDTLKLAQTSKIGGVIGIDLQPEALLKTQALLEQHLSPAELPRVHLYCQSHAEFPALASKQPIRLIVYILGYLPGGDKNKTTLVPTTLESVHKALQLVSPGGAVSIACYPGHPEGKEEEKALLSEISRLSPQEWNVCYHAFPNRLLSPSLLFIQKKVN
jgi:hypothetical protein